MIATAGAPEPTAEAGEIRICAASARDEADIAAFLQGLTPEARWMRYHSPVPIVRRWMVRAVAEVDHDVREALLARIDGRIVGVAEWGREPGDPHRAHLAVVVDDAYRRRGIASALIARLGNLAREHGISEFVATVMTVNGPALALVERLAPDRTVRWDGGALEVQIPLAAASA